MSLDYSFGRIKNYKQVCYRNEKMNPVTHSLIFATMVTGLNEITKHNWKRFYARLHFWEKINGTYLSKKAKPCHITPEEVKAHIGLSTNASQFSDTRFLRNFARKLKDLELSAGN